MKQVDFETILFSLNGAFVEGHCYKPKGRGNAKKSISSSFLLQFNFLSRTSALISAHTQDLTSKGTKYLFAIRSEWRFDPSKSRLHSASSISLLSCDSLSVVKNKRASETKDIRFS